MSSSVVTLTGITGRSVGIDDQLQFWDEGSTAPLRSRLWRRGRDPATPAPSPCTRDRSPSPSPGQFRKSRAGNRAPGSRSSRRACRTATRHIRKGRRASNSAKAISLRPWPRPCALGDTAMLSSSRAVSSVFDDQNSHQRARILQDPGLAQGDTPIVIVQHGTGWLADAVHIVVVGGVHDRAHDLGLDRRGARGGRSPTASCRRTQAAAPVIVNVVHERDLCPFLVTGQWWPQAIVGAPMTETSAPIQINRAPVLTLWAAVVAERLGFDRPPPSRWARPWRASVPTPRACRSASSSRGPTWCASAATSSPRVSASMSTCSAVRCRWCGRRDGLRAVSKGKPGNPAQIEKYLAGKFGERLDDARQAMAELAAAYEPADLYRRGFRLYEQFRPAVPHWRVGLGCEGRAGSGKGSEVNGGLVPPPPGVSNGGRAVSNGGRGCSCQGVRSWLYRSGRPVKSWTSCPSSEPIAAAPFKAAGDVLFAAWRLPDGRRCKVAMDVDRTLRQMVEVECNET